ncbi:MAG: hemerythrin domain-containing protein [Yoonia sp.]|uniref:hemerythrin domain-containing protein n=1 Tax=Yoonia sp. TaxID=2212373 RepID=UPI003EF761E8
MDKLGLKKREKLPDALRVLLAEYPRDGWELDPRFDGLVRFWLDRHLMFRRLMGEMNSATEALLDKKIAPDRFAGILAQYGGMYVNGLHEHHTIEDTHYFPILSKKDKRVGRGFEILDKDHHALDGLLADFVGAANSTIHAREDDAKLHEATGHFHKELRRLDRLMDRHLVDEEELVVPVILKYGSSGLG